METKSSLRRILWSLVYVSLALVGLRMASGVESSQWTTATTARAMWRASPARRRSSSAMRAGGSCEGGLDFAANLVAALAMN